MQLKQRIKKIGKRTFEILEREYNDWIATLTDEEIEKANEKLLSAIAKAKVFTVAEITAIRNNEMTDEEINRRIYEHSCKN